MEVQANITHPTDNYSIRIAEETDLSAIVAIYNATIPGRLATADLEPVSVESRIPWFREHVSKGRPLWVVISEENEVAGYLSVKDFYPRHAYKNTVEVGLYIHEKHRRKGLGRLLLNHLEANAAAYNIVTVTAYIFAHNEPSLTLFRQFGYEQWAFMPAVAIIDSKMIDLVILGKKLGLQELQ